LSKYTWPQQAVLIGRKVAMPVLIATAALAGITLDRYILTPYAPVADTEEPVTRAREIELDAERIANAGIQVLKVSQGTLSNQIVVQATVAARPDGAAVIGARADGTVTEIRKRLGDIVAKGESLGAILSREAARLAEDIASARARSVQALRNFERQKKLLAISGTSRLDYDAAEAEWEMAQAQTARAQAAGAASGLSKDGLSLMILSPISGRVTAAPAVLGSYVVAGTELFRVADPAKLEVQAAVPSIDAQRVAVGDRAIVELPQSTVDARVRAITPDISLQSRAATVVLVPAGSDAALQPGQLVSVRLIVAHGHSDAAAILVPAEAIQRIGGDTAVFVRTPTGFRIQPVTVGTENAGMTEILAGLQIGEEVANTHSFLLKAELEKVSGGDD
jgi:cobalt-zinc-cadmium efflux system membrane fusion protein